MGSNQIGIGIKFVFKNIFFWLNFIPISQNFAAFCNNICSWNFNRSNYAYVQIILNWLIFDFFQFCFCFQFLIFLILAKFSAFESWSIFSNKPKTTTNRTDAYGDNLSMDFPSGLNFSAQGQTAILAISLAFSCVFFCDRFSKICCNIITRLNNRPRDYGRPK